MNPVRFGGEFTFTYPAWGEPTTIPKRTLKDQGHPLASHQHRKPTEKGAFQNLLAYLSQKPSKNPKNSRPQTSLYDIYAPLQTQPSMSAGQKRRIRAVRDAVQPGDPRLWTPQKGKFSTAFAKVFIDLRKLGVYKLVTDPQKETLTWHIACDDKKDQAVIDYFHSLPGTITAETHKPFGEGTGKPPNAGKKPVTIVVPNSPIKQVLTLWEPALA